MASSSFADLKLRTSTLLARLVQRRLRNASSIPLDDVLLALFSANRDMPQFPPAIVDRALLTTLGFSEIQTDILLVLWEAGGELPIWGDGSTPDICHELDMTSAVIRRHLKPLEVLGFVRIKAKDRAQWVKAISPATFGGRLSHAMQSSALKLQSFFEEKQVESNASRFDDRRLFIPASASAPRALLDKLTSSLNSKKTVYGIVTAILKENMFSLCDFYEVRCRSGESIHLLPNWPQFHSLKRNLIERGESPLIEFHTHPNRSKEPAPQDIQKMKMLRRGYWIIAGKDGLAFWYFYHETKRTNGVTRLELHVDEIELVPV